jgi:hypothetical protein
MTSLKSSIMALFVGFQPTHDAPRRVAMSASRGSGPAVPATHKLVKLSSRPRFSLLYLRKFLSPVVKYFIFIAFKPQLFLPNTEFSTYFTSHMQPLTYSSTYSTLVSPHSRALLLHSCPLLRIPPHVMVRCLLPQPENLHGSTRLCTAVHSILVRVTLHTLRISQKRLSALLECRNCLG